MDFINPFTLTGKTIVITGASSGIGRQCAITCNQMGAKVILIGRREEKLKETLSLLKNGDNLYFVFDVTNFSEIETIVSEIVSKVGLIHGLIHSAGMEVMLPLSAMRPKDYLQIFELNVIAGFEFARILSKKKYLHSLGGSFVFISSIMGSLGDIAHTGYCSSKGAINAGVKAMALELASKKIRVNSISPGQLLDTEMSLKMFSNYTDQKKDEHLSSYPLGFGKSADVANVSIFLLSEASSWITGTNLIVDGGYSAK